MSLFIYLFFLKLTSLTLLQYFVCCITHSLALISALGLGLDLETSGLGLGLGLEALGLGL